MQPRMVPNEGPLFPVHVRDPDPPKCYVGFLIPASAVKDPIALEGPVAAVLKVLTHPGNKAGLRQQFRVPGRSLCWTTARRMPRAAIRTAALRTSSADRLGALERKLLLNICHEGTFYAMTQLALRVQGLTYWGC